jgi:hypothetical protein
MKRKGANLIFTVNNELDYMKIYQRKEDVAIRKNQYVDGQ